MDESAIHEYLKRPYARILLPSEEGGFFAEIMEFPGCYAEGDTADEAIANLDEAAKSWVRAMLAQDKTVPEPAGDVEYSGKLMVRLPRSIHRQAALTAKKEGVSLNHLISSAVEVRLGLSNLIQRMADQLVERVGEASKGAMGIQILVIPEMVKPTLAHSHSGVTIAATGARQNLIIDSPG